jgi:hypothetical protein
MIRTNKKFFEDANFPGSPRSLSGNIPVHGLCRRTSPTWSLVHQQRRSSMHYAQRRRKKGCDWCVVKVVTSLWVDRTCDTSLHWHQYSLTSEFLKVLNIYLIELSSST